MEKDVFKRAIDLDRKNMDHEGIFLDRIINSYNQLREMNEDILKENDSNSFSSDLNKFVAECSELFDFILKCSSAEGDENQVLSVYRNGNSINYGEKEQTGLVSKGIIEMTSDDDQKKIYDLLQTKFMSKISLGARQIFGGGWALCPIINDRIVINIESNNPNDQKWFYEESHKKRVHESRKTTKA